MKRVLRRVIGLPDPPYKLIQRHNWVVRLSHWINAACLLGLLMSGLQIFNAHPALYWGQTSDFARPILALSAEYSDSGLKGVTQWGDKRFDTTGLLGASPVDGEMTARGFPDWVTLPGPQWLAMGRLWHFALAWIFVVNGALFVFWAIAKGHARRNLVPGRQDWASLGRDLADHAKLNFAESGRYSVLQKIAYSAVIFLLGPLVLLTGLTMSPTMNAAFPELLWLFGGRQSARSLHFLCAAAFFGFFIIHIAMVLLAGPLNRLRAITTGRCAMKEPPHG